MDRIHFPDLDAHAFVSNSDRWALDKIKKTPVLPKLVAKFYELGIDRWLYCVNMGMSVRCGENQYPTLHRILEESATILDMPAPELYVTNNPFPNAFAGGVERPYIVLRSSMIDTMTDEQLYHLIGHELGHIKAGHVLYFSVANLLFPLLDQIGKLTFGLSDIPTTALAMAFFEWSRQAEFSADRAGLLVSQSLDLSIDATIALAAGPSRLKDELNQDAFLEQARSYQDAPPLDKVGQGLFFALVGKTMTHPMPIHRVQKLDRWVASGDYSRILEGHYARSHKQAS